MDGEWSARIFDWGRTALVIPALGIGLWGLLRLIRRYQKSRFRAYPSQTVSFSLPQEGLVQFVRWLHPKETLKSVRQEDVAALRRFVREGDLAIDIGAHTGDTTVPLALAAGKTGCTLALEPNPYVFEVLRQNAALNRDKTNIVPLNFAATETDGEFVFHYSDGAYCNGGFLSQITDQRHGHRQPLRVQGKNLEHFLRAQYAARLPRWSYVKIDTEGFDRQVLESIASLLLEFRPVVVCEVLGRLVRQEREALYDVLDRAGYDCYLHTSTAASQGPRIRREDMSQRRHFDVLALPRGQFHAAAA